MLNVCQVADQENQETSSGGFRGGAGTRQWSGENRTRKLNPRLENWQKDPTNWRNGEKDPSDSSNREKGKQGEGFRKSEI